MSEPVKKRQPLIDLDQFERQLRKLPKAADKPTNDGETIVSFSRFVGASDESAAEPESVNQPGLLQPQREIAAESFRKTLETAKERAIGGNFAAMKAALLSAASPAEARSESNETHIDKARALPELRAPRGNVDAPQDHVNSNVSVHSGDLQDGPERLVNLISAPERETYLADSRAKSDDVIYFDDAAVSGKATLKNERERTRRQAYMMAAVFAVGVMGVAIAAISSFRRDVLTDSSQAASKSAIVQNEVETAAAKMRPAAIASAEGSIAAASPQQAPFSDKDVLESTPPTAGEDNSKRAISLSESPSPASVSATPGFATEASSVQVPPAMAAAPPAQAQTLAAPIASAGVIEAKKVKTVAGRPDGALVKSDARPDAPRSETVAPAETAAAPSSTKDVTVDAPAKTAAAPPQPLASTARVPALKPVHAATRKTPASRHEIRTKVSARQMAAKPKPIEPQPVAQTPTTTGSLSFLDALLNSMAGGAPR